MCSLTCVWVLVFSVSKDACVNAAVNVGDRSRNWEDHREGRGVEEGDGGNMEHEKRQEAPAVRGPKGRPRNAGGRRLNVNKLCL